MAPGEPERPGTRLREASRRAGQRIDTGSLAPYAYVLPFFLLFTVFGLFPTAAMAYVSLTDWNLLDAPTAGLGGGERWVGLDNYLRLVRDPFFWNALGNSTSLLVLTTVPQLATALVIAQLLDWTLRGRTLLGMGVLLPYFTSVVAVTLVFTVLFSRDFGVINEFLRLLGAGRVNWQADRLSSHLAVSTIVNWRWTGFNAMIYLAAMQAIPRDLYDAAAIDGAGRWRRFQHITVPMLRPTIIFTVIVSTIGNLQLFTEPLLFDTSSPGGATGGSNRQFQTLALYLYEEGFRSFEFGYASAIAGTLFLLTALAVLVNYLIVRRIRAAD
jgi:cellobiose transport system permease protein